MHTIVFTSQERNQRFARRGNEGLSNGVFTVTNMKGGEKMEIRKCRKKQGITQTELAKRIGVAPSTVTQWETGARNPSVNQVPLLASALECSLDDLFGSSSDRK